VWLTTHERHVVLAGKHPAHQASEASRAEDQHAHRSLSEPPLENAGEAPESGGSSRNPFGEAHERRTPEEKKSLVAAPGSHSGETFVIGFVPVGARPETDALHGRHGIANRAVFVLDAEGTVTYHWIADEPSNEPDYDELIEAVRAA